MFTRKQTMHFFKAALFLATVIFASCSNNLVQKKNAEFGVTITLPQASSTESVGRVAEGATWNIKAQVEDADEKPLQTINRTGASGKTVTLNFDKVGVGKKVRVCVDLTQEYQATPSYKGKSDWFTTKRGTNKITLKLEKVQGEEVITNAAPPQITQQPTDEVKIYSEGETEPFTKNLSIIAISSDDGTLSYQWQVKSEDGTWENVENGTSTTITVSVDKGEAQTYKCVVTNTNDNKTATATSDEVTVAYVEGTLTSITATYKDGAYEVLDKGFTYSNVTVQETYKSVTGGQTKTTTITVTADSSRYKISPSDSYENAIGYVPYVVTYIAEETPASLTENITVPVKYELSAENLALESFFNEGYVTTSDDDRLSVPQHGTVNYDYNLEYETLFLFNEKNTEKPTTIKSLGELYFTATITSGGNSIENGATCEQSGDFNYNVTLQSRDDWFVCGENDSKDFTVTVCPWKIEITQDGATAAVTPGNLSGGANYDLSVTNEAYEDGYNPRWQIVEPNSAFTISDSILSTPAATGNDQTAMITATATLNEKEVALVTIKVTVPATLPGDVVSFEGATINSKDGKTVDDSIASVSDTNGITTVTVSNVSEAEDIWAYCATTTKEFNFAANTNYKVYATMYAKDETVVGIAAARADMFFTVGKQEQTYEFETGTLQSDLPKQITIGVAAKATEIYIKDVRIAEITDSGLPTLSFMISEEGIDEYLRGSTHEENIIELDSTNGGYTIGLNSTGVTLQIRDYASSGGLNKATFNMSSTNTNLKTSLSAKVDNANVVTWNSELEDTSSSEKEYTALFPAYTQGEECFVDVITNSTATGTLTISDFAVGSIATEDIPKVMTAAGKVFAIETDGWKTSTSLPFTGNTAQNGGTGQVVLINNFGDNGPENWKECIRFVNDSWDSSLNDGNGAFNVPVGQAITLNADFTVTIEEATTSGGDTGGGTDGYAVGQPYYDDTGTLEGYIFEIGTDYIKIASPNTMTPDGSVGLQWCSSGLDGSLFSITDGIEMKETIASLNAFETYSLFYELKDSEWYVPTKDEFDSMVSNLSSDIDFEYSTFWTCTLDESQGNSAFYYNYGDWNSQLVTEYSDCIPVRKIDLSN